MKMYTFVSTAVALAIAASSAVNKSTAEDAPTHLTKATYSISGLHCPPCTRTVEASLKKIKGVKTAKVDWTTKSAKIDFDENVLSAQQLSQAVAKTPHMMGGGMHYAGWLALKVPDMTDDAKAKAVKDALASVPGVKSVATYPRQKSINVQFAAEGSTSSQQLLDALGAVGIKAERL